MRRIKAQNPRGTHAYFVEPYTVQHFTDFLRDRAHMVFIELPMTIGDILHQLFSKKYRLKEARAYNRMLFGNIPTSQIYVPGTDGNYRQLRSDEERTWPE